MSNSSNEPTAALTELQRRVRDALHFSWEVLSVKGIHKKLEGKVSVHTVRRALAKLCRMGLIERLPAERKGRGYSNLYRLAPTRDEDEARDDEEKEEVIGKDDPLSELNDVLAKLRRGMQ